MALNPRQKKFAELYHRYGNGTRAYGEAGEVARTDEGNYPAWCAVEANRYLRNPNIRKYLATLRGEAEQLSTLSLAETVDYLVSAITTPVGEIGPESPLCEEYTVDDAGRVKTKSVSKLGAIRELARLTGMGEPEKVEVSAGDGLAEVIKAITGTKEK